MMQKYTIQAGEHAARPLLLRWRWKPRLYTFSVSFLQAAYDLADADQLDWNKLLGVSFCLFSNHRNSFMLGWRWNKQQEVFEINAYQHVDGRTEYTDTLFTLAHGEKISGQAVIDYRRKEVKLSVDTPAGEKVLHLFPFSRLGRMTREINTWFGGNREAPSYIVLEKQTKFK